jgi:uncharacterized repeat protein (TIGR01451 family)
MFRKVVSNLSLSPAANSQLTFYWRRLKKEQLTRQLSMVMAMALVAVQVATIVAPPDAVTADSPNDVIQGGGLISNRAVHFTWPKGFKHACDSQWNEKNYLIYIYLTVPDVRALYDKEGVHEADLCKTKPSTMDPSREAYDRLWSYGRSPHGGELEKDLTAGGTLFHVRPLSTWGNKSFKVLEARRAIDDKYFAVLYECGNLTVTDTTPEAKKKTVTIGTATPGKAVLTTTGQPGFKTVNVPVAPPPPAPTPPPAAPPTLTPVPETPAPKETPPPAPVTPATPVAPTPPTLKKTGVITAANGSKRDAHGAQALAGEVIEYTLTTTNTGTVDNKDYVASDNLLDTLEYADVIDPGKGALTEGVMSWPKTDIKPNQSYVIHYQVRIKSPIPSRPTSTSDPLSYDLRMDDVYGNLVSTTLAVPTVAKQVEVASAQLPQTGAGTNTLIVMVVVSLIVFFYFRNRQLVTEVSLLRADHHGHGGHR